jgi:hypothetical protein
MTILTAACLTFLAAQVPALPVQQQADTGAISGVVVDAKTGASVSAALVSLVREQAGARMTLRQVTDAKGRFVFANLPASERFVLTATKSGFLEGQQTAANEPVTAATPIALAAGEWVPNARIPMWRPGAIGGRVIDERGEPVVGVYVRLFARVRIQGRDEVAAGPFVLTDDRGAYRFAELTPGRYLVEVPSVQTSVPASTPIGGGRGGGAVAVIGFDRSRLVLSKYPTPPPPANGRSMAYPIAFYPGVSTIDTAQTIEVEVATEKSDADIRLAPVPTTRVTGTVIAPPEALAALTLRLLPAGLQNLGVGSETATALVDGEGRFTFLNVPAGSYVIDAPRSMTDLQFGNIGLIDALPQPPGHDGSSGWSDSLPAAPGLSIAERNIRGVSPRFWLRANLDVSGREDVTTTLTLRPLATFSGRVTFEADPAQPDVKMPTFLTFMLDPASSSPALGVPRPEGGARPPSFDFAISDIVPAEYLVATPPGLRWLVKSITWNGRDYAYRPIEALSTRDVTGVQIVMTNAVPALTGFVKRDGATAAGVTVVAFPAEPGLWTKYGFYAPRLQSAVSATDGGFRFGMLPAGEYYVVALDSQLPSDWRDPEFLAKAERVASPVKLVWGGTATVDLVAKDVRK